MIRNIVFLTLCGCALVAKAPPKLEAEKPNMSYEEKIKHVCACFQAGKPKYECFASQSAQAKTIADSEKRKDFILATGACDR